MHLTGLLVGAFLLGGCETGYDAPVEAVVRDSAGVVIHEFAGGVLGQPARLTLAAEPDVRIGVVQGAPEYQWTRPVAGARLSDGRFAILEQNPAEVRLFDPSGQFVGRVGAAGDGPGEFRSPVGLAAVAGNTLVVWDQRSRRLTWFTTDGAVIREQTLLEPGGIRTVRQVALSPAGHMVALGATTTAEDLANRGRVRETWQLVPIEADGAGGASLGAVPGVERDIAIQSGSTGEIVSVAIRGRWWWGDGFAWASPTGVWTADRLVFEARHFDVQGGLDRIVRVDADRRSFSAALIDSLHGVELERIVDDEVRARVQDDFEGREYPEHVPPVGGVFSDAAGRVWIGITDPPPERLPSGEHVGIRRWAVFEEEPEANAVHGSLSFSGVLALPPRSHPLYADEEGLLLVTNDPRFDVAYVEWYPLVRSE